MATQPNPALEAAVADLMGRVPAIDAAASAREALARKCPRFVPSSEPVFPMMSPLYWARRMVENVPHVETLGADGDIIGFAVGASVSAASQKAA